MDFVPRSHQLACNVDKHRAGVEFDGRSRAATGNILFPDFKTAQLFDRYRRLSAEQNARQGFFPGIDDVADDDAVADPKRRRSSHRGPSKLSLTLNSGNYPGRWLLGVEQSRHQQKSQSCASNWSESRQTSVHQRPPVKKIRYQNAPRLEQNRRVAFSYIELKMIVQGVCRARDF